MNNPRVAAIITGLVVLLSGYRIFFASETPSQTLAIIQWVIFVLAIVGFIAAVVRLSRE